MNMDKSNLPEVEEISLSRGSDLNLPKGWEMKKLGDVCKTGAGGTPLKTHIDYYEGGKIPWLLSGEINQKEIFVSKNFISEKGLKNSSAKLFPHNTVLIAMYGATAGQVGILRFEAATNQAVCGILPNRNFIPDFLYYFFESFKENLVAQAVGNAQPNISQEKIKNTLIPVPPIPEQQRIVSILDRAFADIDLARANAEKNLQNAKELFESYLQGVFANKNGSWDEKSLGEVSKLNYGYTEKASFEEIGPKFLRITDIQENGVDWETVPYCKVSDKDLPKYKLETGDIVFARTGATTGKSYLIKNPPNAVFASYLIRLKMNSMNEFIPEFVSYFFQTKIYWDKINAGISGSAQGGFNATKLGYLQFSFPKSKEAQQTIVRQLDDFRAKTKKLEAIYQNKIAALDELKKSILQKAFRGEMKGSETMVGED